MKLLSRMPRRVAGSDIQYGVLSILCWAAVLTLFYNRPVVAAVGSVVLTGALWAVFRQMAVRKELQRQQGQFLEFLQTLAASIESGRSMEEGTEESLARLLLHHHRKTELIAGLEKLVADRKNSREADILLLERLADESPLEDLKDFVRSYSVCRRTGGDMEQAIRLTCQIISDKMKLHQELQVLSAQKRSEARMISLMPVLVLFFLRITSPEYLQPLYQTGAGALIMTLALLAIGAGYYWSDRIMEVQA